MSLTIKGGQARTRTPYSRYIAYYPCFQPNTDTSLVDRSGKGNTGVFGAGLVTGVAWGTANRLSNVNDETGVTDKAVALTSFSFDPATEAIAFGFKGVVTPGTANYDIIGIGSGATNKGLSVRCRTTGNANLIVNGNTQFFSSNTTATCFQAGTPHSILAVFDPINNMVKLYVDGVLDFSQANTIWSITPFGSTGFLIGGATTGSGATDRVLTQSIYGIHIFKLLGGEPSNMADIAARLHRYPVHVLTSAEMRE